MSSFGRLPHQRSCEHLLNGEERGSDWSVMAQKTGLEVTTTSRDTPDESGILTICGGCGHLVPRTVVCLYCGTLLTPLNPEHE